MSKESEITRNRERLTDAVRAVAKAWASGHATEAQLNELIEAAARCKETE